MIIVDRFRDSIIFVQNQYTHKVRRINEILMHFSMLMLMLVCLHEVVHKILISSFQLQEGQNRKTILLAKVTLTTSIIGPTLHFYDTVPLKPRKLLGVIIFFTCPPSRNVTC